MLALLARVDIGTAHIDGYTLEDKARGTTQVFNAYSAFIGRDAYASLAGLLPPPAVESIRLRGAIDETNADTLRQIGFRASSAAMK